MPTPLLIVLEGIDGAGTTTQATRLCAHLTARGRAAHLTREPSTGPVGRLLREMLAGSHQPVDTSTLALLFAADRADHLQREVEPALALGQVVVSDRWYHSSLAYQGSDADRTWIKQLNARARRPDLTLFLRVPADVAAARRAAAGRPDELFDRIDTQRRVAAGYDAVMAELAAPPANERIAVLDGTRPLDQVTAEIVRLVEEICAR